MPSPVHPLLRARRSLPRPYPHLHQARSAELGEEFPNLVVLDADLAGATQSKIFKNKYPDRFINCGIAEGNMMSIAAGLSTTGLIPVAGTFAMFAAGRAFEQVRNSIGYPHLNVKIGATHAGISVGEDAADLLAKEGIDAEVIDMASIKPLDEEIILTSAAKTGKVITAEEHNIIGGLGTAVAECLAEKAAAPCRFARIGIHDQFGETGSAAQLIHKYQLDYQPGSSHFNLYFCAISTYHMIHFSSRSRSTEATVPKMYPQFQSFHPTKNHAFFCFPANVIASFNVSKYKQY